MDDALFDDLTSEEDRALVRGYTDRYGGAIVVRCGDLLGTDATKAMLTYRKIHGELPAHDMVWIEAPTRMRFDLGEDAHMDVCLSPSASPETIAALRQIGEAAVAQMRRDAASSEPTKEGE